MGTSLNAILLVCLGVTTLTGCGNDDAPSEKKTVPPATRNVLSETIAALEEDVRYNDVRQETVMSVIAALCEVHVKMPREGIGTDEDRDGVLLLIDQFEAIRSTGGFVDRSTDETDGPVEPVKPGHVRILVGPVRTLLPELRALAESVQ